LRAHIPAVLVVSGVPKAIFRQFGETFAMSSACAQHSARGFLIPHNDKQETESRRSSVASKIPTEIRNYSISVKDAAELPVVLDAVKVVS
jgi:hypothetical protein